MSDKRNDDETPWGKIIIGGIAVLGAMVLLGGLAAAVSRREENCSEDSDSESTSSDDEEETHICEWRDCDREATQTCSSCGRWMCGDHAYHDWMTCWWCED